METTSLKKQVKDMVTPLIDLLASNYIIPDGKEEEVITYALNYFANHRHSMNIARMARKVAEHFKLKSTTHTKKQNA